MSFDRPVPSPSNYKVPVTVARTPPMPRAFRDPENHDASRDEPVALGYSQIVKETLSARLFLLEDFGERWVSHTVLIDMGKLSIVVPKWLTLGWSQDDSNRNSYRKNQRAGRHRS